MKVSVREATTDDFVPLCELFDEIDTWHRDNLPRIFQKPGDPTFARGITIWG